MQIDYRITAVAERRALIGRGHITVAPVRSAGDRAATIIGKDDEARKVLVLTAQAVGDPTADAGMTCEDTARTHLKDRRAVRRALSVHRTDQGQVISVFGHVWKQLGNIHPTLSAFAE